VDFGAAARDAEVWTAWERSFESCEHPNAFHASPAWAEYVAARGVPVSVVVARERDGSVVGLVPFVYHRFPFEYEVGSRVLMKTGLVIANILGSLPLMPRDATLLSELANCLLGARDDCDGILFDSLPVGHPCWDLGTLRSQSADRAIGYGPMGTHTAHLVELRGSFDDYVRGLKPRFRYNVQRAVRMLRQVHGDLEVERCRTPPEAEQLFMAATRVRERSWQRPVLGRLNDDAYQTSHESLLELARRGLLRSYVLRAGGIPCAFVIGYQYRDVYFYAVPGYDPAFSRHSPGSALIYLMLEDLWALDRPRVLSFGRGDDDYKRRFGNREVCTGRWLVLRRTLQNRVRVLNHRLLSKMTARGHDAR